MSHIDAEIQHVDETNSEQEREENTQGGGEPSHGRIYWNRPNEVNKFLVENFGKPLLHQRVKLQNQHFTSGFLLEEVVPRNEHFKSTRELSSAWKRQEKAKGKFITTFPKYKHLVEDVKVYKKCIAYAHDQAVKAKCGANYDKKAFTLKDLTADEWKKLAAEKKGQKDVAERVDAWRKKKKRKEREVSKEEEKKAQEQRDNLNTIQKNFDNIITSLKEFEHSGGGSGEIYSNFIDTVQNLTTLGSAAITSSDLYEEAVNKREEAKRLIKDLAARIGTSSEENLPWVTAVLQPQLKNSMILPPKQYSQTRNTQAWNIKRPAKSIIESMQTIVGKLKKVMLMDNNLEKRMELSPSFPVARSIEDGWAAIDMKLEEAKTLMEEQLHHYRDQNLPPLGMSVLVNTTANEEKINLHESIVDVKGRNSTINTKLGNSLFCKLAVLHGQLAPYNPSYNNAEKEQTAES